jgi:HEPN domain-containing protein
MNEADRILEARRWVRYGHEDLVAAEALLKGQVAAPRQACWLAQQAAEKTIKAVLVFLQIDFPKTHDLDALRARVPDGWLVKTEQPDLAELTEWAVEARYPGDWPDATEGDARLALQQARGVWSAVIGDLQRYGVSPGDST